MLSRGGQRAIADTGWAIAGSVRGDHGKDEGDRGRVGAIAGWARSDLGMVKAIAVEAKGDRGDGKGDRGCGDCPPDW